MDRTWNKMLGRKSKTDQGRITLGIMYLKERRKATNKPLILPLKSSAQAASQKNL